MWSETWDVIEAEEALLESGESGSGVKRRVWSESIDPDQSQPSIGPSLLSAQSVSSEASSISCSIESVTVSQFAAVCCSATASHSLSTFIPLCFRLSPLLLALLALR